MKPSGKFEIRNPKSENKRARRASFWVRLFFCLSLLGASASAQQSSPAPSPPPPIPAPAPAVIISSGTSQAATPAPTVTPTPSLLKKTGVKIEFLPPPMEGTISLGIYDHTGKLVRVLHREAGTDEFVAALDGFITHWDGLDDAGKPLPPGQYSARGYMVGRVTVRKVGNEPPASSGTNATLAASPTPQKPLQSSTNDDFIESGFSFKSYGKPFVPQAKIRVDLVANPLDQDRTGSAELSVGFDVKGSWLQLSDGLPLKRISNTPNLKWVAMGRSAPGEPLVVFQSDNVPLRQIGATTGIKDVDEPQFTFTGANYLLEIYTVTKIEDMMAFDCGSFNFAGPEK